MSTLNELPVVVIGAGPVGLAAAAHLHERGLRLRRPGSRRHAPAPRCGNGGTCGCSRPWRYNIDPAARRLLDDAGWVAPDPEALPTGARAGRRLPRSPSPSCRSSSRTCATAPGSTAISRLGLDRLRTAGRDTAPFLIRLADGDEILARAVIDASGTWGTPERPRRVRPARPRRGRRRRRTWSTRCPTCSAPDRDRFAGRHTLVVGAGHSAANTLLVPGGTGRRRAGHRGDLGDPDRRPGAHLRRRGRRRPARPRRARHPAARARRRRPDPAAHRLLRPRAHPDRRRAAWSSARRRQRRVGHRGPDRRRHRLPARPHHRRRAAPGPRPDPGRHPRPGAADRPERALLRHRARRTAWTSSPTPSPATTPSA